MSVLPRPSLHNVGFGGEMILHRMNVLSEVTLRRLMEEARREADRHRLHDIDFETLRLPDIVIIDMDGTLIQHRHPAILRSLELFGTIDATIARIGNRLRRAQANEKQRRPPRLTGHRVLHRLRRLDLRKSVSPAKGAVEFLNALNSAGIPVALVSNGLGRGYGRDILAIFDLERHFGATIFRENVYRPKPDPESLIEARKVLGERGNGQIWCIGDQNKDVHAVRAARKAVDADWRSLFYSPFGAPSYVAACYADYHFADWHELKALLDTLRARQSTAGRRGQILDSRT